MTVSDREGRMITVPLWHVGGRKKSGRHWWKASGGWGAECQSRHAATPVCNQHLYPSSLATAKHCNCLSHLFVHPQKFTKPLTSIKTKGRRRRRLGIWAGTGVVALNLFLLLSVLPHRSHSSKSGRDFRNQKLAFGNTQESHHVWLIRQWAAIIQASIVVLLRPADKHASAASHSSLPPSDVSSPTNRKANMLSCAAEPSLCLSLMDGLLHFWTSPYTYTRLHTFHHARHVNAGGHDRGKYLFVLAQTCRNQTHACHTVNNIIPKACVCIHTGIYAWSCTAYILTIHTVYRLVGWREKSTQLKITLHCVSSWHKYSKIWLLWEHRGHVCFYFCPTRSRGRKKVMYVCWLFSLSVHHFGPERFNNS